MDGDGGPAPRLRRDHPPGRPVRRGRRRPYRRGDAAGGLAGVGQRLALRPACPAAGPAAGRDGHADARRRRGADRGGHRGRRVGRPRRRRDLAGIAPRPGVPDRVRLAGGVRLVRMAAALRADVSGLDVRVRYRDRGGVPGLGHPRRGRHGGDPARRRGDRDRGGVDRVGPSRAEAGGGADGRRGRRGAARLRLIRPGRLRAMRTALEMARAVRERAVSPLELVEEALRLAERWQPVTNAFSQLHGDEAVDEARRHTDRVVRDDHLPPMHGVPVAVKDLFDVAGWETTGCCAAYRGRVAERDAEAVHRLRAAGTIVIGKTNQHELAAGATNLISACGATANPWDPGRITGGSSGGSGAAVAARVVPVALGTDTGGSIRIPASMCGVTGLKPTHGTVSLEGVMPLAPSLDTVGPLAASVEDVSTVHAILTGTRLSDVGGGIESLTIGSLGGLHVAFLQPEVLEAVMAAADVFEDLGASTTSVVGEECFAPEVWEEIAWSELAEHHGSLLESPDLLHRRTAELIVRGRDQPQDLTAAARARAGEVRAAFLAALSEADVLLAAATLAGVEWVQAGAGRLSVRLGAVSLLTRSVNLASLPAVCVPAGFSSEGLPIGIQLIGRPGEEDTILRAARAFQEATDHHATRPELPAG